MDNQLCNHLLDQLQSFECYHMLLNYFLLVDWKSLIHQLQNYNPLLLQVEDYKLIKLQLEHQVLYQFLQMLVLDCESITKYLLDQVRLRLILHVIKELSKNYFNILMIL